MVPGAAEEGGPAATLDVTIFPIAGVSPSKDVVPPGGTLPLTAPLGIVKLPFAKNFVARPVVLPLALPSVAGTDTY